MVHLRNSHAMIRDGYDSPGPSGDGLTARWRAGETGWCCRGSGATHSPCVPCKHHHPANAGAADMRPPWRWRRAMPPARAGRRRRRRGSAGAAGAFPEAGRFAAVRTVAEYWSNSGQTAIENRSGRGRAVVKLRSKSGQTAVENRPSIGFLRPRRASAATIGGAKKSVAAFAAFAALRKLHQRAC